jgi:hypothetical protein
MDVTSLSPAANRPVVFGVYRDGDNNLDAEQARNITDFIKTTARNPELKVIAENTTALPRSPFGDGDLRTESSVIQGGAQHVVRVTRPEDMSDRTTLAAFVQRSLEAKSADPAFAHADVWVDLVDHGGGDGGGLQSDTSGGFMSIKDIGGAIADGKAAFRRAHPGGDDSVTGVVANQCLMATLGFADVLSRSGVRYLAASPETMLAPGVPSAAVADALTRGGDWATNVVNATMRQRYGPAGDAYHPAAAFDVFDLEPRKVERARQAVLAFDDAAAKLPRGSDAVHSLKADVRSVRGMVRFDHSADMPWHADRPAEAMYDAIATDRQLPASLRSAAGEAAAAVRALVLAHKESSSFGPFNASYTDAAGPTVHAPLSRRSFDSWAEKGVSETHNSFYDAVDGRAFARVVGGYNAEQDRAGSAGV